jgi:hypothetical protein
MALTYASIAYICLTLTGSSSVVLTSKIVTKGKSSISDSTLALLAPVDQFTKLLLAIGMAASSQGIIFSLECTLMIGASILGVYFSSLFL